MIAPFDIPLNAVDPVAKLRLEKLLRDPWLCRKTDRVRRLSEHHAHLYKYLRELCDSRSVGTGTVVDIGPGPGEFLELCRYYGHKVLGIDAPNGRGGMGDEYLEYSRLMTARQDIPVDCQGFVKWICQPHEGERETILSVNSRGSIEQALSKHMIGEPHDLHHDCRKMAWSMSAAMNETFEVMFDGLSRLLVPGGLFLVVANGALNATDYDSAIVQHAEKNGSFELVKHVSPTLHKWRKK
jgi:SAM-dependent methyltransferase